MSARWEYLRFPTSHRACPACFFAESSATTEPARALSGTSAFTTLVRRYQVTGVPKTVVDDSIEILGAVPEDAFVAQALGGTPDSP